MHPKVKNTHTKRIYFLKFIVILVLAFAIVLATKTDTASAVTGVSSVNNFAAPAANQSKQVFVDKTPNYCGSNPKVYTTLNLGCAKKGNPILDLLFALIKFLTAGAALVITASMAVGGIQYITSGSSPDAAAKAKKRLTSNVVALMILIFSYAILNYIVPVTILR